MDVSIFLEQERIFTALDGNGKERQFSLPRKAPKENPMFVDAEFESMPMVYVNDEAFQSQEKELLERIAEYIRSLPEVSTISVNKVFWKEPVISALQELKKKGITISGEHTLTKEEYEKLKDTEVINVEKCDESLLEQENVYLTAPMGYQSEDIFSTRDEIKNAKRQEYVDIKKPLTPESKHDLEQFFHWNKALKRVTLSEMSPTEYVEIVEFLKPFMDQIPELRLTTNIKDNLVEQMTQIAQSLKEQSQKVTVQYGTHLLTDEWIKNSCSLQEYIVMDEILSSYQQAIESHDYSPLEKLIYAYDIVKNAQYKEVAEDTDYKSKSRKLHSVVLGGEIVCVGYSNLLNGLLTKLQIPATEYSLSVYRNPEREEGHQRSAIYLQDPKYGINGLFICDPTWDAKSTTDLGYDRPIDRYNYFLLPYDRMKFSKGPENVNALSALFLRQDYLESMRYYSLYQKNLIDMNQELGLIDVSGVIDDQSEEFKAIPYNERDKVKRDAIYAAIREQLPNFRQEIPFETIASAIETVRRTEGVYESEAALGGAIAKIIELHDRFKSLAFSTTEKTLYIEQDGKFQVLVTPVEELNKEKTA